MLLHATAVKFILGLAALALTVAGPVNPGTPSAYAVTALLALAMGLQNAAVRKMSVPDFTTTVLTLTMTGIAADFSSGADAKIFRRLISVVAMFTGALLGAVLVLHSGLVAALSAIAMLFGVTMMLVAITKSRSNRDHAR